MQNITMRQVADRAKVSIKTGSRVVNNESEIADGTHTRVLATIGELWYKPNMLARSPATHRSHMSGLVVPDICNPFFAEVACGVKKIARIHSYRLVIANTDMNLDEEFAALELLDSHGADGMVIVTMSGEGENVAKSADRRPIVTYQNGFMHPNVGRALAATYLGGRMAVEHLVAR